MNRIRAASVTTGGLLAGLTLLAGEYVLNILILGKDMAGAAQGFEHLAGRLTVPLLAANTLALGVVIVWLYAALHLQFGAGLKSVLLAAMIVWFLAWFHCAVVTSALGVLPPGSFWATAGWGLVEVPAAALAGAWLYRRLAEKEKPQQ